MFSYVVHQTRTLAFRIILTFLQIQRKTHPCFKQLDHPFLGPDRCQLPFFWHWLRIVVICYFLSRVLCFRALLQINLLKHFLSFLKKLFTFGESVLVQRRFFFSINNHLEQLLQFKSLTLAFDIEQLRIHLQKGAWFEQSKN